MALALLPPYLAQGAPPPTLLTTAAHHGCSPLLRRQVACAVIEEALQHGLATKISRKEVRYRYSHRCAAYSARAPRTMGCHCSRLWLQILPPCSP